MNRPYRQFYAMIKNLGYDKESVVAGFTGGATTSCRELSDSQFMELFEKLDAAQPKKEWTPKPGDKQRKKMISIAKQMGWHLTPGPSPSGEGSEISNIMKRLDQWALKQKFKKPLMQHSESELNTLLSIFEEKIYASYLKGLNR